MKHIHATEVFLVDRTRRVVWLGLKKTDPFRGMLLGFGGKREKDETLVQCALRETNEESGCVVEEHDLRHIGVMRTHRAIGCFVVHLYVATRWVGRPVETKEMRPVRVSLDSAFPSRTPIEVRMILDAIGEGRSDIRMSVTEDRTGSIVDMTYRRTR